MKTTGDTVKIQILGLHYSIRISENGYRNLHFYVPGNVYASVPWSRLHGIQNQSNLLKDEKTRLRKNVLSKS